MNLTNEFYSITDNFTGLLNLISLEISFDQIDKSLNTYNFKRNDLFHDFTKKWNIHDS